MRYEEPNLEIMYINMIDVVTASDDLTDGDDLLDQEPYL